MLFHEKNLKTEMFSEFEAESAVWPDRAACVVFYTDIGAEERSVFRSVGEQ